MIERFVYPSLPAMYEISLSSGSHDEISPDSKIRIFAEDLDNPKMSRQSVVGDAVMRKAQNEGIEDLDYSMRLMRPQEIRQYMIPKVRWAICIATEDELLKIPVVKSLTNQAIGSLVLMHGLKPNELKTVTE